MNIKNLIKIIYLADCREYLPALAKLWFEEISRHWVKDASIEKAKDKLILHLNKDKMPMAIVATYNNIPIGMACLRETDGIQPGVTPWLGSLVVDPKFRGNKIGETLVKEIKSIAKKLGYNKLHLLAFDPTIPNWYTKLGWQTMGSDELFGHRLTVMDISL